MSISVLESPNFTGEPMPPNVLQKLTGPSYVAGEAGVRGRTARDSKARVLGEFARHRGLLILPGDWNSGLTEGADLARAGRGRGASSGPIGRLPVTGCALRGLVGEVTCAQRTGYDLAPGGCTRRAIDCDGIGGVFDILNSYANRTYDILAVRGSMSSPDREVAQLPVLPWGFTQVPVCTGELTWTPLDIDVRRAAIRRLLVQYDVGWPRPRFEGSAEEGRRQITRLGGRCSVRRYNGPEYTRRHPTGNRVLRRGGRMDGDDDYLHEMGGDFWFQRILV